MKAIRFLVTQEKLVTALGLPADTQVRHVAITPDIGVEIVISHESLPDNVEGSSPRTVAEWPATKAAAEHGPGSGEVVYVAPEAYAARAAREEAHAREKATDVTGRVLTADFKVFRCVCGERQDQGGTYIQHGGFAEDDVVIMPCCGRALFYQHDVPGVRIFER